LTLENFGNGILNGAKIQIIANIGKWMHRVPFCNTPANCFNLDQFTSNLWLEKNVMTTGLKVSASGTHDCGTGTGAAGCTGAPYGPTIGDNQIGTSRPLAWGADRIPHSLYRTSTSPPSWWCAEACSWDDVSIGIGAFGDDFSNMSALCKLPAEIRFRGEICTPIGGSPLPPAAPVLLD
jgi:hypothetical protein